MAIAIVMISQGLQLRLEMKKTVTPKQPDNEDTHKARYRRLGTAPEVDITGPKRLVFIRFVVEFDTHPTAS